MNCCVLSLCNTESKLFAIYTAAKQKKIFVCSCLYAHADFNGKNKMHLKLPNVYKARIRQQFNSYVIWQSMTLEKPLYKI